MRRVIAFLALSLTLSAADRITLRQNWQIQSAADLNNSGAALSTQAFEARGWYPATVPSTVLSALVAGQVYPDPYFGMNLRSIPGTSYRVSVNFSNVAMPPDSPFRNPWWYRTKFDLPASYRGKTVWLGFDGINFRANVWLNGRQIVDAAHMAGAWRVWQLDITAAAHPGETNVLAVEVFPPLPHDLAITFVDWNPMPPDKVMGLWRDVWVAATGPVALRFPAVTTHLHGGAAELTVRAEAVNATDHPIDGTLSGSVESIQLSEPVHLAPHETRVVHFKPVTIDHPRLWWPAQVGDQNLYPLDLSFQTNNTASDSLHIEFGVREITSEIDAKGHRLFHINGKNILIRGAGYTFDMLLRSTPEHQDAELRYVRDMNLNAVRFEGKMEDDHFLDLADRYGILVLAGWCCCDHWEKWNDWDAEDETIAAQSLRDQLHRMARHPSLADFMYGSDNPPPPKIERIYLDILKETEWPNPFHSSATAKPTPAGPTGVKMNGPYEYVAPSYWYLDDSRGGAHGFSTEIGPGPSPPPIESLRRMLPPEHLWPIDSVWDFHAGGGAFKDIHVFTEALDARYGKSANVDEFARKAQMMAYETHRAMFEAYGRNKYTSTGVVQWMLNNAWPSLIWHLYDWYMRPGGSYFGVKKANEPIHVQYSYDDRSVVVVNSLYRRVPGLKVAAKVYNLDMTEKFSKEAALDAPEDSSTRAFTIPEVAGLSSTYFVSLRLSGAASSENFYWLSTAPETLDWPKSDWYHTPTKTYADYTALNSLPHVELKVSSETKPGTATVSVTNPSRALAFGIRLKVTKGSGGDEVLPVLWEDNYFSLLPGETRRITATYAARDLGRATPAIQVEGWNAVQKKN